MLFRRAVLVLALCACSASDPPQDDGTALGGGDVEVEPEGTSIDATSEADWAHLDLQSSEVLLADEPGWDVAFQRYHTLLNEGVSAVSIAGADFDTLETAPADAYAEGPLDDWYSYDVMTHVLSPADTVYVLRTVEGDHYKLQFLDYYDDAGTPGFVTVRWAPVGAP